MSIKSNIEILKSWLSEKVKVSYEQKDKLILQNLEVNTKQTVLDKWNSKNDKLKES
jgi:hypothetical protein